MSQKGLSEYAKFCSQAYLSFLARPEMQFLWIKTDRKKFDMNMYTDFACMCAMSLLAKQPRFSNTVHIIFKRGFSLMMRGHLLHLLQNCFASFYAKIMSNCKEQSSKKICSKAKFTSFEYTVSATFSAFFGRWQTLQIVWIWTSFAQSKEVLSCCM